MKKERLAIVSGIRTPFCKAGGVLKDLEADDLGAFVVKELMERSSVPTDKVDEVIFGNVMQPPHATNIARVLAVKGGIPIKVPAFTVNRNCSSGMEAVTTAWDKIRNGEADIIIAGGTESMSNFPVLFKKKMRDFLVAMNKAKGWKQKLSLLLSFRPGFLVPEMPAIADPLNGLTMGQTAELVSRDFRVTRAEQDEYALNSHLRAAKAQADGFYVDEIVPIPVAPKYQTMQTTDDGPRANQTLDSLKKLNPAFERQTGSVTAGNASPLTDGAAALLVMSESKAKELGLKPLGYLSEYSYVALDPSRMGLGPTYAIAKLLQKSGKTLNDIDLIEINEAFAAQVLGVIKAGQDPEFAKRELGLDKPIGQISLDKLNVNGGAIAIGHPLGASGTRLILTLLRELRRRDKKVGIAALCIGGGQGEACLLEVE
jgi:acetyl-CoA acyltransferase